MSQQKVKANFGEYHQINMQDVRQVDYWTQRWNITIVELIWAAKAVNSTMVSEVEVYLKKNRK